MPRPRTPTAVMKINGTAKKHPERMREREGEPEGSGADLRDICPPAHLPREMWAIWDELRTLVHAGSARENDTVALELLVRKVWQMRNSVSFQIDPNTKETKIIPGAPFTASDQMVLRTLLNEFGMTPASRSKVSVGSGKKQSRFGRFKDGK